MNLTKRLEALEAAIPKDIDPKIDTIIISALERNNSKPANLKVVGASAQRADWYISRDAGELEEDFIDRAKAAIPRKSGEVAMIFLAYGTEL